MSFAFVDLQMSTAHWSLSDGGKISRTIGPRVDFHPAVLLLTGARIKKTKTIIHIRPSRACKIVYLCRMTGEEQSRSFIAQRKCVLSAACVCN